MLLQPSHVVLGLGVLLASLSASPQAECGEEPRFQGRSLTLWLNDLAYGRYPDMEKHSAAVKAVRGMGVDAIPILMNRITTTSESPTQLLRSELKRDAQMLQDTQTVSAFEALGPASHSEIPTLIGLLAPQYDAAGESPTEPECWLKYRSSDLAGRVLEVMGAAAVNPLLKALEEKDPRIRFGAVGVLENTHRRSQDDRIVPAILKRLRDEDTQVRWVSARALGSIGVLSETCVPALAECVRNDPEGNVRSYALMALKKFGPRAKVALPAVMAATTDENSAIRSYARDAVKAIQADAPGTR